MVVAEEVRTKYKPTIGVECHVQLKTKTKLFSAVGNDARQAEPNTLISHIDVGMPGALPYLNQAALELAVRAAYALGSSPQKFSHFDRKHYFYPDLPKGYQITQYANPIIVGGHVHIIVNGEKKCVGITRAHLEEDAGKTIHPAGVDYSLVDLNRAGTPLLEIVSDPDIHSAQEAKLFCRELYLLMKYAEVSEADLYHGNMRFDVNISVSNSDELGNRAEIKNLNSFRSVEGAVAHEINRQIELLENGQPVPQETRGWDEAKQKTTPQRTKEEAEDYRYFPEPDIPPLELDDDFIKKILQDLPLLPPAIRMELGELKLNEQVIEDIISSPDITKKILDVAQKASPEDSRRVALWFVHAGDRLTSEDEEVEAGRDIATEQFVELSKMVGGNQLSSTAAMEVFWEMLKTGQDPLAIAEAKNLLQVSDQGEIEAIVKKVIDENTQAAQDVKNGETKAIGFLVGQVMKASAGKANPKLAQDLIKKQLGL